MSKNQDTKQGQGGHERVQGKAQPQPNKGQPGQKRQDGRDNKIGSRSKSGSN